MNDKFSLLKKMRRLSGILVHPTSLPSKFGVGDLGPEAYRFVDFLQEAGQHLWQTLPLGPTGGHNSPYQCFSSFAGQPLLISPELLLQEGLLAESDLSNVPAFPEEEVDFKAVQAYKEELFKKAFTRFKELPEDSELKSELALFCKSSHWLDDYAMFMAIKKSKDGLHWLELSDIVRIDHFRGLESYWEIPADSETALNGKWVDGPKDDFFETLIQSFGEEPPIIAEDLGIITDEVRALRDKFGLPGMKILQFAFEDDDSNYLPYNQPYNCVCYTGTHDNDTTTGWYASASEKARDKVRRYMNTDGSQISWDFIRTCFGTPARFALIPIQDLFCQGSEYRMNTPGKAEGNWAYRVKKELLTSDVAKRLYDVTKLYGR